MELLYWVFTLPKIFLFIAISLIGYLIYKRMNDKKSEDFEKKVAGATKAYRGFAKSDGGGLDGSDGGGLDGSDGGGLDRCELDEEIWNDFVEDEQWL